ncbi:arsenate reductase [Pseudohongiella nitratireducens]|jgi:arsenate reductase|uniref:Arsenate reductase n=1 Tax=Pseudohongiella nitratireducens TaxID=1768907 RepID=A0A917GUY7_9GAMM|nr:arsenate reductase (glutaredoxin) [Pseudohongiella nitratireducens]MDF1623725.1 arsenate reductase (glutaredoxin) [Pseudohongiella nitratireducens]GGG57165.1 arsenate reductase [Pseudohongiella nitratireducens]|tara:strand:+ start:3279 stop:3641 length:363 start_codon:yes stop_codon:yes gene_type:complete
MTEFVIFHNPRCSKSRQTLTLLQKNGIDPTQRLYLQDPPDAETLQTVLSALGISARELMRTGEPVYTELDLADDNLSEAELIDAMASNPILIERPVVVFGDRAVLGRPPENVLTLIEEPS